MYFIYVCDYLPKSRFASNFMRLMQCVGFFSVIYDVGLSGISNMYDTGTGRTLMPL